MTVTVNEEALASLLQSEEGPVGQDAIQLAQEVVLRAKQNVRVIMWRMPTVADDVDYVVEDGLRITVGIRDAGEIARYLDEKEGREQAWLLPALARAMGQ